MHPRLSPSARISWRFNIHTQPSQVQSLFQSGILDNLKQQAFHSAHVVQHRRHSLNLAHAPQTASTLTSKWYGYRNGHLHVTGKIRARVWRDTVQDSRTKNDLIWAWGNSGILVSAYACDVGLRLAQYEPAEPCASGRADQHCSRVLHSSSRADFECLLRDVTSTLRTCCRHLYCQRITCQCMCHARASVHEH